MKLFESTLADYSALIAPLHEAYHDYMVAVFAAGLPMMRGDFARAEREAQEALAIGNRAKLPNVVTQFSLAILPIRREQGRGAEVEPFVRSLLEQYPDSAEFSCIFAMLQLELGRDREAREVYQPLAEARFSQLQRVKGLPVILALLAEIAGHLGDGEGGAILYERLLLWRDRQLIYTPAFLYGSGARQLGILAGTMGRWEDAARHFEDALAMNTRMGARPWLAHTQFDCATMLLRRNGDGDRERAQSLLQEALATAQDLGMVKLAQDCESLLSTVA